MRRVDHRRVDHHVVVDELGGARAVGENAPDGSGDEKDELGSVGFEPVVHGSLVPEVELVASGKQQIGEALVRQTSNDGRAHEPSVPRHEDTRVRP